ncbi:MAG: 30S ribosomal protein S15 [Candidatus Thermoplasmatota archaeon]|nr:30S ribosomal protein S15 [Candidatus Thermoplasmatota archaeon]
MARMHTRKRGKSGSSKDYDEDPKKYLILSDEEIKNLVISLNKEGLTRSQIGIRLRDQHAVAGTKAVLGKKIGTILRESGVGLPIPEDLNSLIQRYKNVRKHLAMNKKDMANQRKSQLIMSKILRLVRYYKSNNYIASNWSLEKVL